MIQRQQTLWLLLATLAALFCFMFPFATGKVMDKGIEVDKVLKAGSGFLLLIFSFFLLQTLRRALLVPGGESHSVHAVMNSRKKELHFQFPFPPFLSTLAAFSRRFSFASAFFFFPSKALVLLN